MDGLHRFQPGYSHQEAKAKEKEIFAPMGPEVIKEATSLLLSLVWVYPKIFQQHVFVSVGLGRMFITQWNDVRSGTRPGL